jgi:hypothetical protein
MEPFDFDEQFEKGAEGEDLIAAYFGWKRIKGRGPDLLTPHGAFVELKTDRWDMEDTENFFIERYGDFDRKTLAGPWKALRDRCQGFLYFYRKNGIVFGFNTKKLIERLQEILKNKPLKMIPNRMKRPPYREWVTEGYLVKRSEIEDLAKVHDLRKPYEPR